MAGYYTHYRILNQGVKPERQRAVCPCWCAVASTPVDNPWPMEPPWKPSPACMYVFNGASKAAVASPLRGAAPAQSHRPRRAPHPAPPRHSEAEQNGGKPRPGQRQSARPALRRLAQWNEWAINSGQWGGGSRSI